MEPAPPAPMRRRQLARRPRRRMRPANPPAHLLLHRLHLRHPRPRPLSGTRRAELRRLNITHRTLSSHVIPAKAGISFQTCLLPCTPFLWKKKRYGQKKPISGSDAVASHPEFSPEWEGRVPPRPHSKRSAPARPQPIPTGRSPSRLRDSARNPPHNQAFRPLSLRERPSGRPWQSLQPINHTPIVIPAKAGISRSTNDTPSRRIPPYRPEGPFIPFLWKKKRYGQKKPISGSDAVASHPELSRDGEGRVPPRPHVPL